jgi:hypothetical protein
MVEVLQLVSVSVGMLQHASGMVGVLQLASGMVEVLLASMEGGSAPNSRRWRWRLPRSRRLDLPGLTGGRAALSRSPRATRPKAAGGSSIAAASGERKMRRVLSVRRE